MKSYRMSEEVPVSSEVDVLVAGGGPAGVAAAFAAAKLGMKTLIVEQFNCLGGVATAGGHGHICLYSEWGNKVRIVGGVPWEMSERTVKAGYGRMDNSGSDFEVEGMKLALEQMAEETRTGILYHSFVSDTIVEDGKAVAAVVQSKDGRHAVKAKRIIDCTGDGDVCAKAGCGFAYGDEETGHCQPVTLMFTIGGVDWKRVDAFRHDPSHENSYGLDDVWRKAQENGDMRPFQHCIMGWWWTPTRPDQVGVNFTHVNYIDSRKAGDLTKATIEARKQAYETIEVYRKYVPGMERCHMVSTPNTIGIRESRRIRTDYIMTKEDVLGERSFEDSIGYGSFFIDIHNCSGPGMDKKTLRPRQGFKYQMPFRMLLPKGVENLLVAGRCAGATHEALGSLRVMPQCGVMGQAAGVAAALSIKTGVPERKLDTAEIQRTLRAQSCIVDQEDIDKANSK